MSWIELECFDYQTSFDPKSQAFEIKPTKTKGLGSGGIYIYMIYVL